MGFSPVFLPHGPEALLVPVRHVVEDRVAHVEYGLGASVVLLQLDDPAPGEAVGELHDVLVGRPPEGVDRLGVVPHDEHIAMPLRQIIGDLPLRGVRVLELVHHHVGITLGDTAADLFVLEKDLQVEEEVVVVEALRRDLVLHVLFPESLDLVEILVESRVILLQNLLDGHLLVEGHAEDLPEHILPGPSLLLRIEAEPDRAPVYRLLRVRLVVHGECVGKTEELAVPAQDLVGKGMKGAALHALTPWVVTCCPRYHLLRASPREGEEDDGRRVDAGLHEVKDAKLDHPRLAASRAGDDEDRAVNGRNGLVLAVVELSSYLFLHLIDRAFIEYSIEGGGFSGHIRMEERMYDPGV